MVNFEYCQLGYGVVYERPHNALMTRGPYKKTGKTPAKTFGAVLRAAREAKGWTQEQFAERLDVSPVTVNRYEKGKREPSFDMVRNLAEALGLTVSELFGDTVALSKDERELLEYMRDHPREARVLLHTYHGLKRARFADPAEEDDQPSAAITPSSEAEASS